MRPLDLLALNLRLTLNGLRLGMQTGQRVRLVTGYPDTG